MTRLLTLALVVGMAGCGETLENDFPNQIASYRISGGLSVTEFYDSRNRHCIAAYPGGLICDSEPTGLTHDTPLPDLREITNE